MSVTQKLMGDGRFTVRLNVSTTPVSILNKITAWSHIVITNQPLSPDDFSDTTILANAKYTGVVLKKNADENFLRLDGKGLGVWLGDKDSRGMMINTPTRSFSNDSINTVLNSSTSPYGILRDDSGNTSSIIKGTVTETGTNFTGRFIYTTAKTALQELCVSTGAEYRINPDGEIDVGAQSALFVTTPETIIVRQNTGEDPNINSVGIEQLSTQFNAEDYVSEVRLLGEDAGFAVTEGVATQSSIPYKDLFGNTMKRTALVSESNIPDAQKTVRATATLDEFNRTKQSIRLLTDSYDVKGDYQVGDNVFIYDPVIDFTDNSNQVEYRGEVLHPVSTRVLGITYPISSGYGIYHRDKDGNYTDLGGYVDYEDGSATVEVGETSRSLFDQLKFSGQLIQDKYAALGSVPGTPTSVAGNATTYLNNEGITEGAVDVTWNQPNNTDGTTIVDGYQYRIRYKPTTASGYQYVATDWDDRAVTLYGLITGTSYHIGVAAVDTLGYESTYSSNITVAIPADTTAPSQPKQASAISTSALRVLITHNLGKQGELNDYTLERDIERLNVYGSTTSGFTVNTNSKIGEIPVTYANIASQIPVMSVISIENTNTNYFRFTVDRSGNESAASTEQSATATLINSQHIASAAIAEAHIGTAQITEAKIGTAAITTAKIANAAITNAKIDTIDAGKITAGTISADRISAGSLDFNKITDSSITIIRNHIQNDAINQDKIANDSVDTAQLINDAVDSAILANNAVFEDAIQSNAVSVAKIVDAAISSAKIANSSSRGTFGTNGDDIFCSFIGANSATLSNRFSTDSSGVTITGTVSILPSSSSTIGNSNASFSGSSYSGGSYGNGSSGINIASGGDLQFVRAGSAKLEIELFENQTHDDIRPVSDDVYDLGSTARRFDDIYATNTTIQTSDITLKKDVETTSLGLDFIDTLTPIEFKWKDGGVRTHLGFSAQDVKQKLIDAKGESQNYAIYTQGSYEKYYEKGEEDEYGGFDWTEKEAGEHDFERYGLRSNQLIPILVKSIQELKDRVEALEA